MSSESSGGRGPWYGVVALIVFLVAMSAWVLVQHLPPRRETIWSSGLVLLTLLSASLALGTALAMMGLRHDRRRRLAERAATQQSNLLQSILDNLGDGVAVADPRGRLTVFNPAAERILGIGPVDSDPEQWPEIYGLFKPDTVTRLAADELPLARAVAGEECRDVEMFVRNPELKGGVFIRVTATPLRDQDGVVRGGVSVFRDITERKWAEALLRDSEARFRAIVEATASALIILSPDHLILEFNPEAERITGGIRGEVIGESFLDLFVPEEYRERMTGDVKRALTGRPTPSFECPVRTRAGGERVVLWSASRLTNASGQPLGVIATGHDITERREAEEALRLRQLAGHLQSAREDERARIAREIHDELGQALTGLKFEVSHLSRQPSCDQAALREKFAAVQRQIDGAIGAIRRIATTLRPGILDELGLLEAIKWQAGDFAKRTGIRCSLDLPEEDVRVGPDHSTAMFRIFQEALTNVARHSAATEVAVRIAEEGGRVTLELHDNGRGIKEDEIEGSGSFGLLGMRERARMFGGTFRIRGAEAGGTTILVSMPR